VTDEAEIAAAVEGVQALVARSAAAFASGESNEALQVSMTVPEPASASLLLLGASMVAGTLRRRRGLRAAHRA
jgi:hypothetical protein